MKGKEDSVELDMGAFNTKRAHLPPPKLGNLSLFGKIEYHSWPQCQSVHITARTTGFIRRPYNIHIVKDRMYFDDVCSLCFR